MPSLRDIRKHISAVKNIKQITYAMKMVASARIKKAQNQILSLKPYVIQLENVISTLKVELGEDDFKTSPSYRFFHRDVTGKVGIVIIAGDKGLCGSFNTQILEKAVLLMKENSHKDIYLILVGKKAVDFFKKVKGIDIEYQMLNIFPKVNYSHAAILSSEIIKMYDKVMLERVYVVYGEFKNMLNQEIKSRIFLPLEDLFETQNKSIDYFLFEPDKKTILTSLITRYINIEVYRFLLENQASELAARMNAMELANKNAAELLDELTLSMNKLRQAQITTELTEIVSGANAVNQ